MNRFIALACVLAVGACTTPDTRIPPADRDLAWQLQRQSLAHVQNWQLSGRMALQAGDEGGTASLHWRHGGAGDRVRITGAWGKGLILMEIGERGSRLVDDRGTEYTGANAAELLYRVTGWQVPIDFLRHWLLGLPGAVANGNYSVDAFGRLASATQDGWQIRYPDYRLVGQRQLPRILKLTRNAETGGRQEVSVRLVVDRWQVEG